MFVSHGSNHSRGVLILIKDNLDFKIHSTKVDSQSRYIFLDAYIQDSPYFLLNIYAPNKCIEQFLFFKDVSDILKGARVEQDNPFIVGGKRVYLLSFRTTLETKLREFQFKILNRIVFTNEKLFRFGMAESDKCVFCQTEVESIEHLLFSCKICSVFWKHVFSWLRDNNIIVENWGSTVD